MLSSPLEYLDGRWDREDADLSGGRVMGGEPDLDAGMDVEKMLGYEELD